MTPFPFLRTNGKTKSREIEAFRAGGGQAPGVMHHIITGGLVQSIGKPVIRDEKKAKAKRYLLTGK